MKRHLGYPSINLFHRVVENLKAWAAFHGTDQLPTIIYSGSVKLHGTNVSVACELNNPEPEPMWAQGREHILTPEIDTAKFLPFFETNTIAFSQMLMQAHHYAQPQPEETHLAIFGEWVGPNVFSGTGVGTLPNRFVVFGVRIFTYAPTGELLHTRWLTKKQVQGVVQVGRAAGADLIFCIFDFVTYEIRLNFNDIGEAARVVADVTRRVAQECPVAHAFGLTDVGEGVVWQVHPEDTTPIPHEKLRFKSVGELHTNKRSLPPTEFEIAQVARSYEFVSKLMTEARLATQKDRLIQSGVAVTAKNIGLFLKAVNVDCFMEEYDNAANLDLEWNPIAKLIQVTAKQYWKEQVANMAVLTGEAQASTPPAEVK